MRSKPSRTLCLFLAFWLASFSTAYAWFFGPGSFGGGFAKAGSVVEELPEPSSQWNFDETGGTTVADAMGVSGLTQANGTLASGKLVLNGSTNGNYWAETSSGTYGQLTNFTVVIWYKCLTLANFKRIVVVGNGTANNAVDQSFWIGSDSITNSKVYAQINASGLSTTLSSASGMIDTTNKVFIALRYTRTGGASNNILKLDSTKDGSTWDRKSTSTARLMNQNAAWGFRNKGLNTGTDGMNGEYYRAAVYDSVLTDDELQAIYDAGSES